MNYKKHYDLLIERGKNRMIEGYVEKHHIIPRCMGGGDERENLVQLTPEEHYVAHQLLMRIYPSVTGLAYATQMMTIHHTESRTTNKLFGWIRKKCALSMSESTKRWQKENGHPRGMAGKKHTDLIKTQIGESVRKIKNDTVGIRIYAYNIDGTFYKEFRTLTECAEHLNSTPINVSTTAQGLHGICKGKQLRFTYSDAIDSYIKAKPLKNKKKSRDHIENMKKSFAKRYSCIHCGFESRKNSITRYHNENCKHNKDIK